MKFFNFLIAMALSTTLTGCGHYLTKELLNGPKPCLPSEQSRIISNNNRLHFMEPGQTKQELLDQHNMGKPDAYDMKKISDNEVVEVFYYQVASKTCEWASKKTYLFEPIVVQNDVITGIGGQAYERLFNQAQAQEKRSKKEGGIFYNQLLSFASFN